MKLWHDDLRPPPEGWKWARTNDEAKEWLSMGSLVSECSLDHDLGLHTMDAPDDTDPEYWDKVIEITHALNPSTTETGYELVEWMVETEHVPDVVTIHSWNPDGAMRMARRLANAGYDVTVAPFKPRKG